jgi:hypothetical protein
MIEKITRIGEVNGASISVITDALGSQVIIFTEGRTYISSPQQSHEKAIVLGKNAMNGSVSYFSWPNSANDF